MASIGGLPVIACQCLCFSAQQQLSGNDWSLGNDWQPKARNTPQARVTAGFFASAFGIGWQHDAPPSTVFLWHGEWYYLD
jgi:hypothetical protein